MKFRIAVVVVAGWIAVQALHAQAPPQPNRPAQNPPANPQNPPAPANTAPATLPRGDVDPVRSPDEPQSDMSDAQGFSSSSAGLDNVMPPPDTDVDSRRGKKGRGAAPAPDHQETAAEDEKVGDYYLSEKNWRAALSRYQSAMVLDPENPAVYWGLGEAQRHLGKLAEAKAAYEKLVEYDPDSKHGKEARKLLKDPQLANAASVAKP